MTSFFLDCIGLFDISLTAAMGTEFFAFVSGALAIGVCYGVFMMLYRGGKRKRG